EAATFPDILATVLEGLIVVGGLVLFVRPALLSRHFSVRWLSPVAASSVIVVIAGSAGYGLTPRFAHSHSHGAVITGNSPCEKAGPPASQGQVFNSSGHTHRGPLPQ